VYQEQDVAPAAALCALLGDQYRFRTLYQSQEPIPVIRLVVVPSLRHFFVNDSSLSYWRAHEATTNSSSTWKTHVGTPDSIWCLDQQLQHAMYARATATTTTATDNNNKAHYLHEHYHHDDGGMADMIIIPTATSALSLFLWQRLVKAMEPLPKRTVSSTRTTATATATIPPLVIVTLGNLRGVDWVYRKALAMTDTITTATTRPLALVGFPTALWYCRLVPNTQIHNHSQRIITKYTKPSAVVLMVGHKASTSIQRQQVMLMTLSCPALAVVSWNVNVNVHVHSTVEHCFWILRHTIFPPQTALELVPFGLELLGHQRQHHQQLQPQQHQPYVNALLWSLLQDPHWIQFPCYSYWLLKNEQQQQQQQQQQTSVGYLIISVFEELLLLIQQISLPAIQHNNSNYNASNINVIDNINDNSSDNSNDSNHKHDNQQQHYCPTTNSNTFLSALMNDPKRYQSSPSLLAQLLGMGGTLVEDITNNRIHELLYRLPTSKSISTKPPKRIGLVQQPWLLEPLVTRAAHAEWYRFMVQSPFDMVTTTSTTGTTTHNLKIK
jgi:hypothetical protein